MAHQAHARTGESIPPILSAAKRLRQVREAQREFLLRWSAQKRRVNHVPRISESSPFADPQCRDWSRLYRGSVLDD